MRLDKNFFKVMKSRSKGETLTILELIFADDTFLCTDNEDDLQKAVTIFSLYVVWIAGFCRKNKSDDSESKNLYNPYSSSGCNQGTPAF